MILQWAGRLQALYERVVYFGRRFVIRAAARIGQFASRLIFDDLIPLGGFHQREPAALGEPPNRRQCHFHAPFLSLRALVSHHQPALPAVCQKTGDRHDRQMLVSGRKHAEAIRGGER